MHALTSVHSDVSLVHALLRTLPVLFVRLLTPPWMHSAMHNDVPLSASACWAM
ncbi:MAG: hypothetical protein ACK56F_32345 [bacterium]